MKFKIPQIKPKLKSLKTTTVRFFNDFKNLELIIFLLIVIASVFFRFINISDFGLKYDTIDTQYEWGNAVVQLGYGPFWALYRGFFDYLPGALIYLGSINLIAKLFDPIFPGGIETSFIIILKFFNNFADLALAVIVYQLAKRQLNLSTAKSAITAAIVYTLPSLWFISSIWGQFDTLIVVFSLLSIIFYYLSLKKDNGKLLRNYAFWSGVFFALGFWLKVQIMIVLPVFLILFFSQKSPEYVYKTLGKIIKWLMIMSLVIGTILALYIYADNYYFVSILLILGFFGTLTYRSYKSLKDHDSESTLLNKQGFGFWVTSWIIAFLPIVYNPIRVFNNVGGPFLKGDSISNGASTFWPLIGFNGLGSDKIFSLNGIGPSVGLIGILIYGIALIALYFHFAGFSLGDFKKLNYKIKPILGKLFERDFRFADFVLLMAVNGGFYFMFMTKMHSRYLIWSIIFSIVAVVLLQNAKKWLWLLIIVIILHIGYFLNQLGVYIAWTDTPDWTEKLFAILKPINTGIVSSALNLVGVLGLYVWAWIKFSHPKS